MATTVTVAGTDISDEYSDFQIDVPLSETGVAPTARIVTDATVSVSAGDAVTIDIDGTTKFDGFAVSGGKINEAGRRRVQCRHDAVTFFEEEVSISLSSPNDSQVLGATLSEADSGGDFTIDYAGTATSLANDYDVENRSVKRVFRDMMDRTGRVWWVDPAGNSIKVEPKADRGLWQTIDTSTDNASLTEWDSGSVESVRNDITVIGTGGEALSGSASDTQSILDYGRQSETINVSYILSQFEAVSMASELLVPDPLADGVLLVGQNVADVTEPLVNYNVAVTDSGKDVDAVTLIEKQTIKQGRAELQIGEGSGVSLSRVNRQAKSDADTTEPGTVMPEDRIGELSISETKIQDDSISTPKLQANAITANEIDTLALATDQLSIGADVDDEIVFGQLSAGGGTVAVMEPAGDALIGRDTNRFDAYLGAVVATGNLTLDGTDPWVRPGGDNTGQVGTDTTAWSDVWAYNFVDADTGSAINDGGDVLASLSRGQRPPDHCRACDKDGEEVGIRINSLTRHLWEICTAQQSRLEAAEERIDDLEERLAALE